MTTLKLEAQQAEGGGGGDVTREYVDQRDAATLDSANGYTDLVASGKQNTLTAGTNITIEDNVISADGITGVSWGDIDGNLADQTDLSSALGDKQDALTAGANISIDANNEISATDTTYTAGANITIDANNEISATDTTYSDFGGATSGTAGTAGLVPAPASGDTDKYLKSDGSWAAVSQYSLPAASASTLGGVKVGANLSMDANDVLSATDTTYSNFTGTDGQTDGAQGLVPGPLTTDYDKFLSANGTWQTPPGTTYTAGTNVIISAQNVISSIDTTYSDFVGTDGQSDGDNGLVPAPIVDDVGKFLKSDGTWATVQTGSTITMQSTDPGEGQPLAANNFIAVY